MGCCASVKVSPVENIEQEDEESKTKEKISNEDFGQNDDNQIRTETQLDDEESTGRKEVLLGYNSSSISSDCVAKTEECGLQNHDRERIESVDHGQIRLIDDL